MRNQLLYICLVFFCLACSQKKQETKSELEVVYEYPAYAKLFYTKVENGVEELVVKNPWDTTEIYATYKIDVKENPKVVALSGTAIGFIDAIDKLKSIKAVSQKKYVYHPALQKEEILEVGESHQLNTELLLSLQAQYIFVSGFEHQDKQLNALQQSIKTVYTLGWMEDHPLARAEWIKFYAKFFGEEKLAEVLFKSVEAEYNDIANLDKPSTPSVMLGNTYKDVWYSPGGNSYLAKMMEDAGASYYWSKDSSSGSLSLNIEDVIKHQLESDYWINTGHAKKLEELKSSNSLLGQFTCVKEGNLYNYTKRENEQGGNDFWERGVVYPNKVLKDYVKIFHPQLIKEPFCFYEKLP